MLHERCRWDCRNNRIQDRSFMNTPRMQQSRRIQYLLRFLYGVLVPVPRNLVGLGSTAACIDLLVSAGQRYLYPVTR